MTRSYSAASFAKVSDVFHRLYSFQGLPGWAGSDLNCTSDAIYITSKMLKQCFSLKAKTHAEAHPTRSALYCLQEARMQTSLLLGTMGQEPFSSTTYPRLDANH